MARTRTGMPDPGDDPKKKKLSRDELEALQAAAFILEDKGAGSLLYNSQVVDYMVNSIQSGNSLAWYYWARIPELRYTTRYIANALSVATLFVGKTDGSGSAPERLKPAHPAYAIMEDFGGGYTGQAELLDRLGLHLTVIGDSVLIGPKSGSNALPPPFDQWRVFSSDEVSSRSGKIYLQMPGNAKEVQIPDGAMAVRIWRPHPRHWWDADSPVKGSFAVLRELDLLDQHVQSSATSRLAGAGFLGIPEELDLPTPETETEGTEVDQFIALLTEVMGLALKNPDSAAARVPIMLRGPGEFINQIKHFDFSTAFDQAVPTLREGAIRRLSLGMDVPPEVLLGSANSNSWSAWQTDESTLRVHLVPLLQLICSSLTVGWLRPILEQTPGIAEEEIDNIVISYDVSKLLIRQDVSGDAEAMYDRFEIGGDSLRKALGYSPNDEPTNEEIARQILLKLVATGQPDLVAYAIDALRDNYGLKDLLPKASSNILAGQLPAPGAPAAPSGTTPAPVTPKGPLPGDRSQAKQTSPPPVPKAGDQSNNAKGNPPQ